MSQEKRIELIKQLLEERQELSTKDIMEEFGVSQDTARRDIVLLTKRGEVKRTHGGILPLDFGKSVPNFQSRLSQFTKQKTQIANEAAKYFLQHEDYAAFCKAGGDNKTTICHVTEAKWVQTSPTSWYFEITANRFLRNMVRAVVGTLIDVGRGKISMNQFLEILHQGTRSDAGESMPGNALFLEDVSYPEL